MLLKPSFYRKLWWCIVIVGSLLVGMISSTVQFSQTQKIAATVVWCILLLIFWYGFNAYSLHRLMTYLRSLEPTRTTDSDSYRSSLQQLLQWKHFAQVTAILQISIANTDCDQWDFTAAKQRMQQIQPHKIHGLVRLCYWLNMTYILFHLNEIQQAKQMWAEHKAKLLPFANNPEWGFTVRTVEFFDLFYSNQLDEAQQHYERIQQKEPQALHYDQQEMDYLHNLLQNSNLHTV